MKVWMNGELLDKADAKLSVFDHGLLYGDGVFEGIRIYGGKIFQCDAHLERLFASARKVRLAVPYGKMELTDAMKQTLSVNGLTDGYIRLAVTRGVGTLGLNPFQCSNPTVFVIADYIQLYPKDLYEHGMPVIISRTVRTSARMLDPSIKSLNYLNNILAKIECIDAGANEAIMLNEAGNISEATGDNVFIVKGGALYTPPPGAGILLGITRAVVISIALRMNINVEEKDITPGDLYDADECFLTGTAAEVIPVTSVDGKSIGGGRVGAVTRKLFNAFHAFIRSQA